MTTYPNADNPDQKPIRLLASVPETTYSRLIVRYGFQTDSEIASAYHQSAKRLASTFRGDPVDDVILLPFLMLYRHAFELTLKHLIRELAALRARFREPNNPYLGPEVVNKRIRYKLGHRLVPLFNEMTEHYLALDLSAPVPGGIAELVGMLHEADRMGTGFKYAGELPDTQEHVDFPILAALLDDRLEVLSLVEDYTYGLFSNVPNDFHY